MNKDVLITLSSQQRTDGQEQEPVELSTVGKLTSRGPNGWMLSYLESPVTGMEGTRSTFRIEPDCVTLVRTGSIAAQMVFQIGRTHTSVYMTPYGSFEIGITARRIVNTLTESGGRLLIAYNLDMGHMMTGGFQFDITVRELKTGCNISTVSHRTHEVGETQLRQ